MIFVKPSVDPLVGNYSPAISIFSGLGGHGLSFFSFRAVIAHIESTFINFHAILVQLPPPLLRDD